MAASVTRSKEHRQRTKEHAQRTKDTGAKKHYLLMWRLWRWRVASRWEYQNKQTSEWLLLRVWEGEGACEGCYAGKRRWRQRGLVGSARLRREGARDGAGDGAEM
jgi:hypothetical protein